MPLTVGGGPGEKTGAPTLSQIQFDKVFTSPLKRAVPTCELAGLSAGAKIGPDLIEWDYGEYEGLTSDEILRSDPN